MDDEEGSEKLEILEGTLASPLAFCSIDLPAPPLSSIRTPVHELVRREHLLMRRITENACYKSFTALLHAVEHLTSDPHPPPLFQLNILYLSRVHKCPKCSFLPR